MQLLTKVTVVGHWSMQRRVGRYQLGALFTDRSLFRIRFAIPTSIMKKVIADLKEYGTVQRAVLGIKGTPINDDQQMMPEEIKKKVKELGATDGVLIAEVIDGGSAAGNLEVDDVIIGIDGNV